VYVYGSLATGDYSPAVSDIGVVVLAGADHSLVVLAPRGGRADGRRSPLPRAGSSYTAMSSGPPARLMSGNHTRRPGMLSEPQVIERAAQPYAAIRARVTMQTLGTALPALHPRVFGWLGEHGIAPAGAPFWKYNLVDMDRELEVEVGVPVAAAVDGDGDGQVLTGVLPPGRYATLRYTGDPSGLADATASLLQWAHDQGLAWDVSQTPDGQRWGARLEIYETDPAAEPDMSKWTTQLAFLLSR
jgi:effector-binding domain-containing protein